MAMTAYVKDEANMKGWYTLEHIKKAWTSYKTDKVMRVLKEGKWHTVPAGTSPRGSLGAKMMTCDKFMSFPTFLEKYYA